MNFQYAVPPFTDCSFASVSSEHASGNFPANNVLDVLHPARPWRTNVISSQQSIEIELGTATPLDMLVLNNVNYKQITLQKRATTGGTLELCSPNVLLWSERIAATSGLPTSPWARAGSSTVTVDSEDGPYLRRKAQTLVLPSLTTDTISQSVTIGVSLANKKVAGHIWLKSPNGSPGGPLQLTLSDSAGNGSVTQTFNVTTAWQRHTFALTIGAGGTGTILRFLLNRVSGTMSSVVFGGAQVSPDQDVPLPMDYHTEDLGVVIPIDWRVNRRKCLLVPSGFNTRYLTINIPANQTTDDSAPWYSTGSLLLSTTLTAVPGEFSWPFSVSVAQPVLSQELAHGGRSMAELGGLKASIELGGPWVSRDMQAFFTAIAATGMVKPLVICESTRPGGSPPGANDPSQVYIVRRVGDFQVSYPVLPEVAEAGFVFDEVV
jgi:hypothetical protein